MPETSFVSQIAQTLYGFEPQSITPLDVYQFDWRGIYRLQDAQGGVWVMRLLHDNNAIDSFTHSARVLDWLAHQAFPAPSVRRTTDQQLVDTVDGWVVVVLSYVDGSMLGLHAVDDFGAFAQTVNRLHSLEVDDQHQFAPSRCHPEHIATAAHQLASHGAKVPEAFKSLVVNLHTAMLALEEQPHSNLCITHGDCWYMNAIKVHDGSVALIDWDQTGVGLPLLDLGNMLLTSHFDLTQPLQLEADESTIKSIIQGYQQHRPITRQDKEHMANAMRFLLAYQLGEDIADDALFLDPNFPFVLQKLQARYDATQAIADIAIHFIQ